MYLLWFKTTYSPVQIGIILLQNTKSSQIKNNILSQYRRTARNSINTICYCFLKNDQNLNKSFFWRWLKYMIQFHSWIAELLRAGTVGAPSGPFAASDVYEYRQAHAYCYHQYSDDRDHYVQYIHPALLLLRIQLPKTTSTSAIIQ